MQVDAVLAGAATGTFAVRNDLADEQALVLSLVSGEDLVDYAVSNRTVRCAFHAVHASLRLQEGLVLAGSTRSFASLTELVAFYAGSRSHLPHVLLADPSRANTGANRVDRDAHRHSTWSGCLMRWCASLRAGSVQRSQRSSSSSDCMVRRRDHLFVCR